MPCIFRCLHVRGQFDVLAKHFHSRLNLLPGMHLVVEHNQDMIQAHDIYSRLEGYIPTFGLHTSNAPIETRYGLKQHLEQFLASPTKTFVVLGEAGSGKSVFSLATFVNMLQGWHSYRKETDKLLPNWLPIYIPLKNHSNGATGFVSEALRAFDLDEEDICALRDGLHQNQKLLFILDGYDEMGSGVFPNLPQMLTGWHNAKVLITSRPEHFGSESQQLACFALHKTNTMMFDDTSFEVHHVSPITPTEIEQYVLDQTSTEETYKALQELPGLLDLLSNPFLLNLALQSLKVLQKFNKRQKITRTSIYLAFSEYWFGKEAFKYRISERDCVHFAQDLAFALFTQKTTKISTEDKSLWPLFFRDNLSLVRITCPLRRIGSEYSFLHKSLYEFFAARHLWDTLCSAEGMTSSWSRRMLTEERAIIEFLVEMYQQQHMDSQLLSIVLASRNNTPTTALAAANAITVLNAAGFCFSGMDLSRINISGADLEGALLHHTVLLQSNLSGVKLSRSFLNSADLSGCNMSGMNLGEWPMLPHKLEVNWIAISHTGEKIATACGEDIFIWLVDSRQHIGTLQARGEVRSLAFSPNGQTLASGGEDKTVKLWDTATSSCLTLSGHAATVRSVAFSPDGLTVASGSSDKTVRVWNTDGGATGQILEGHKAAVNSIAFSPDGSRIASGSDDHMAMLWDLSNRSHKRLEGHTKVMCVSFSPDGLLLACAGEDKTVKVWNLNADNHQTIHGHSGPVMCVAFSPTTSATIASCSMDKTVKIWNMKDRSHRTLQGHSRTVTSVTFVPNSSKIASGSRDGTVKLWDPESNRLLDESHSVWSIAFSPKGSKIAYGCEDSKVRVWNLKNGERRTLTGHTSVVDSVAFSLDGCKLASGCRSNILKVWDFASNTSQTLQGQMVGGLTFSTTGGSIFTGGDRRVKVWNINSGTFVILDGPSPHRKGVQSVAASPNGTKLVTGSLDHTVKVWDIVNRTNRTLNHAGCVRSVAFSPDGTKVASGSDDTTLKVWDVENNTHNTLTGHQKAVMSVAFSPDSSMIASGSDDTTVKVWNLHNGTCHTLWAHHQGVKGVAFSHDGFLLASGSQDGTVKVWDSRVKQGEWVITHTSSRSLNALCLESVTGLSAPNKTLLLQLGGKL